MEKINERIEGNENLEKALERIVVGGLVVGTGIVTAGNVFNNNYAEGFGYGLSFGAALIYVAPKLVNYIKSRQRNKEDTE